MPAGSWVRMAFIISPLPVPPVAHRQVIWPNGPGVRLRGLLAAPASAVSLDGVFFYPSDDIARPDVRRRRPHNRAWCLVGRGEGSCHQGSRAMTTPSGPGPADSGRG